MKKLMIAIGAAALCGMVFAEGIESNIVGYQYKALDSVGYNMITPTFKVIGQDKIDLQSIKLEGAVGDQTESIVVLNENGNATGVQYYWLSEEAAFMPDGWYDDAWNPIEGVQFKQGEGFYLYAPNEVKVVLPFAGEVDMGEQKCDLAQGYTFAGNSSPRDLDLQSIKLEGAIGDQTESIVVLNENGNATGVQYYWLSEEAAFMPDGWYDDAWNPIEGVTVKAGEALMVYSPNSDQTKLALPAIDVK